MQRWRQGLLVSDASVSQSQYFCSQVRSGAVRALGHLPALIMDSFPAVQVRLSKCHSQQQFLALSRYPPQLNPMLDTIVRTLVTTATSSTFKVWTSLISSFRPILAFWCFLFFLSRFGGMRVMRLAMYSRLVTSISESVHGAYDYLNSSLFFLNPINALFC
jgi:hypothetical protein